MENKSLSLNTIAVHGGARRDDVFGAINEPIYLTSNYRIPTDGTPVDWSGTNSNIYQRNRNPNQMVLQDKLCALTGAEGVKSVTGLGLMLGVETEKPAADVIAACREAGVLVLKAKNKVRLLPALNIPDDLLEKAVGILKEACK